MWENAVRLAGVAHLISLGAILIAPARLRWREELARVPRLLRQMCDAYHFYTSGTIVAMGLVSLLAPSSLTDGSVLARCVCGYVAVFWAARLGLQFYYDFRPHLTTRALWLGYHGLTVLFVAFIALYGAVAAGANG